MSLEVRAAGINLRVVSIERVLKAMRLEEITQEWMKIEKRCEVWVLGHRNVYKSRRGDGTSEDDD